ncbi:hypothetical protein PLESTM_000483300 [Pleodorina starrii]|nr:hypothetical protein PLESTM_000483300 [Pleodorina starrii]
MFGFSGTTGFGQPAQQPAPAFGAAPASPFGAAFGQAAQPAASPFGAATGSAPLFGAQSPAPAFGQAAPAAAPAFGATTGTTGFGTGAFGAAAKPAGFGGFGTTTTAAPNPFGAPAQSAPAFGGFGAASAPAFGAAAAAAPANPFGATTTGFGATAAPAFGAAPAATGFGAPAAGAAAPFGTTTTNLFGQPAAAPSPFGAAPTQPTTGFGGFGAAPTGAPTAGTRNVPYNKTKDPDVAAGQPATFLMSMSALPNFQAPNPSKSHEELRWEDYEAGVKNQSAGPAPAAAGAFGAPAPAPGGFGGFGATTQPATTGFGAAAPANPFGAPASAPAFGATTTPAFGAASQPSLFGAAMAAPAAASNPFGGAATTAPAFGGFGAAPAAASQPSLFGSTTTAGFGSAAPFGGPTTPFGGASSAAAFSFSSSPAAFGAASAPATSLFGTAPASSPFGGTTSALGAVGSPFGAASTAAAFGTNTFGAFGATAAKPASPFGAPAATTPFGATAPPAAGTSLFGNTSPFNFASQPTSSPSLFGNTAGGSTMSFSSNLFGQPATAQATGGGLFGSVGVAAAPSQPPTVAQPAYGNFGTLPSVPEVKVGITTRAARNSSISSGASKASPLLSLRPTPLRYGASVRARSEQPSVLGMGMGMASSLPPAGPQLVSVGGVSAGASDLLAPQVPSGVGSSAAAAAVAAAAAGGTGLLPFRQNPHRLFIAAPPPSTEAAGGSSFLTPARPPSAQRATTPDAGGPDDVGHVDAGLVDTPGGAGLNGYANGYASGGAAGAGPSNAVAAATATGRAAGFQDAPTSEPHLPRLGRLVSEGFSFSPNVDELRLLHSQNSENLAAVSNFTVSRAGVGQVRWVVPVDVRGQALYDIVSISYGEVLCYPDASTKPPQGQGLNKPAEITLYGVYKKDKNTGAPIKDGPRGQAYEKALRQMCGRMGAKFLSYKLDGGVWKFEVEHFSRYGLIDIDDDDETQAAPAPAGTPAARGGGGAAAAPPLEEGVGEAPVPRRLGLDGDADAAAAPGGGQPALAGRGLAGFGLRGFAFGGAGGPAASAAGRTPAVLAGEDSGMEPSVGARWQQRQQQGGGALLLEAGGSEATGVMGAGGPDQDMSEACAQLRFGDDLAAEGEVSGGVVGPETAAAAARGGGGGGSTATEPLGAFGADGGGGAAWAPSQPAAPLQHALPDSLAQDPVRVRALHDAFFSSTGGGGGGAAGGYPSQPQPQQQQQRLLALPGGAGGGLQQMESGAGGAGGFRAGGAGAAGARAAAAAMGATAVTAWRRAMAALAPGAPAAVAARGEELLSEADGGGIGCSGFGGGVSSSPISLALARPITMRPVAAIADGAAAAVLPLRDVRTAGNLTDAGLAMGRSFRVGWGPGGRLVVPGAADATTATEICITRVRVEGEGAAYGEASYGGVSGGAGSEEAEGLEALRDRLRAGLEVHLAASRMQQGEQNDGDDDGDEAAGADGAPEVPHWRLCIDSRELSVLVQRHVQVCEQQLQQLLGGGGAAGGGDGAAAGRGGGDADADHPDALRLRHEVETWHLVQTLFAKIDGEVPEAEARSGGGGGEAGEGSPTGMAQVPLGTAGSPPADADAGGGDADLMLLSTPPKTPPTEAAGGAVIPTPSDYDMGGDGDGGGGDAARPAMRATAAASRTLLAAQQRHAQLSLWLQRQARRRVEEDLQSAGSPAAVVLQLLAAHQLAAAVGAAVAAGDPRLAMLIARAGSRASSRAHLSTQLAVWQQSGFLEHVAPERLAAFQLLAGEVLEPQRLMTLDWRRLLGLYLWYGTPNTRSPVTAVKQYVMDRHSEPAVVPHPAPYHVEGLQPSATGAGGGGGSGAAASGSTDVQWELLQLWATTPAAATADCLAEGLEASASGVAAAAARALAAWLDGGGCSRLLRCSGYSPNPLDHSLAWHLMAALQAVGVLPPAGSAAPPDTDTDVDASARAQYDNEVLTTTLEFISQLLLAGGLCEWAVFVALTIPDLPRGGGGGDGGGPAVRRRVVRELLAMSVPEWSTDSAREAFLSDSLHVPTALMAEARATWTQYTRDDDARCTALLAAGDADAAHDVFVASVAPALFLSGAWTQLAALVEALEPAACGLPSWSTGGGLYGGYLALFGPQLMAAPPAAAAGLPEGVTLAALDEFAKLVQEAQLALNAAGGGGGDGLLGTDEAAERQRLRRRLVLGRISARVHGVLMSMTAGAAAAAAGGGSVGAGWETRFAGLQAGLALQGCLAAELQLGGIAVAVAEAGGRVACS